MSKVRDLPELISISNEDLMYMVDASIDPNGGRKIKASTLQTYILSPSLIKTAYESNPNTNAYTDAEKAKLATVQANAAFQTAIQVPYDHTASGLVATNVQAAIDEINTQADFKPTIVSGRILHYSQGTVRFDGTFFALVDNDILLNPNVTNGYVYVDTDGFVKQTASNTLPPPYTVVFAKFTTDANNITALEDQRVKNSQNLIRSLVTDVTDINAGDTALAGSTGRVADAGHQHYVETGIVISQTPDQANAEGTGAALARADHVHDIPTGVPSTLNATNSNTQGTTAAFARQDHLHAISTGVVIGQSPDQANAAGISANLARADHTHNIPTAIAVSVGSANAQGAAATFSRADHVHQGVHSIHANAGAQRYGDTSLQNGTGILITDDGSGNFTFAVATGLVGDITTLNATNAAAAGATGRYADAGHVHPISTGVVIGQTPDQVNAAGSSANLARADHTHNIPTGVPSTLNATNSNTQGTVAAFARQDHLHAISTGVVIGQSPDQVNAAGTSANLARADHVHNIPTAIALDISTANSQGSGSSFARADHTHKGVHSVKAGLAGTQRFGDLSIDPGNGTTVTDDGSGNFTVDTTMGPNELVVTQGAGLNANYTGGKVRINGTTYTIVPSFIAVTTNATNGRIYVDVDGIVKSTTSTTTPPNAVPLAIFSSNVSNITALSDNRTLLNVNITFGLASDIQSLVPDAAAAAGTSNKYAAADHVHNIPTAAAIGLDATSTNTQGSASTFARSNHTHALSTGIVIGQTPDQSNAAGTSANLARADHVHNIPTAAAVGLDATSTNTQGAAATFARSNHTHALSTGVVSGQTPDQANAAGTSANLARADHVHNIPTAVPTTISTSSTNTQGTAAAFARADHVHNVTVANQQVTATSASGLTTTAATDTLITGMTITPVAGTYLVLWTSSCANSANGAERTFTSVYFNGTQVTNSEISIGTSGGAYSPVMVQGLVVANGTNAIEIRARVAGGTTTYRAMTMQLLRLA